MATELLTSTDFYFLNQNFEAVHKLTQFESLMWVDKYDEPGSFEIYAPPLPEIKEAAQVNNYFKTSRSDKMMIVEELETTVSPENGKRLVIRGRSLESILDRRVIFLKCYFRDEIADPDPDEGQYGSNNLEDAIRQLLDYCFIHPIDTEREMNLVFQYSDSPEALEDSNHRNITDEFGDPILCDSTESEPINSIHLKDCEFEKGENCLNIVMAIVKQAGLGFQITVNEQKQFVFKLTKGKNRTTEQLENPAVVFSPTFNNIKNTKFTEKYGETYKNFVYTEGETYKSRKPTIVKTGDAEGLLRREVYVESSVVHETEASNVTHEGITKNKKTLSEDEYQEALTKDANKYFEKYSGKTTCESEVEPRLTFQYGRDFGIGDILEIQDGTGNTGKVRCVEFIISYSASGYEEYPTFKNFGDDDDTPSQSTTSGGQYTDGDTSGGGGGEGHVYDLEFTQDLNELNLTEDGANKTELHLAPVYVGTEQDFNSKSVAEKIKYKFAIFDTPSNNYSHVGQIIESTTLDTEAKVKAVYGASTSWIQHTGYMLRGASSGVVSGSQGQNNDGGADSQSISSVASHNHTQDSHNHTQNAHSHKFSSNNPTVGASTSVGTEHGGIANSNYGPNSGGAWTMWSLGTNVENATATNQAKTATNQSNGATFSVSTLPKYKNVYIWERIA